MSFLTTVQAFNQRHMYQIDSNEIYRQVAAAMRLVGTARDRALTQVVCDRFAVDVAGHERVRMDLHARIRNDLGSVDLKTYTAMADPVGFLEGYVGVVEACAKEFDPQYKPQYMLGLTKEDAKRLQRDRFNSYTIFDDARHVLLNTRGIEKCKVELEQARFSKTKNMLNHYPSANQFTKSYIEDGYVRKEILKSELKEKGFFWRLFHPIQTRSMRNFIQTAEQMLRTVDFTPEDGMRVMDKYRHTSAATSQDMDNTYDLIDEKYAAEEMRQAEMAASNDLSNNNPQKEVVKVDIKDLQSELEDLSPKREVPTVSTGARTLE